MSVIQLHRCDAVSLSHLWPTYFKSVLVSRSKTDPYKLSVEIRACPSTKPFLLPLYPPSVEKRSDRRLSFPTEIPRFRSNPRRIEYPWLIARGRGLPTPTCLTSSKRYRANVFRYRAQRQIDSSRLTGIFLFASFPPSLSPSLSSDAINFIIRVIWDKERVRSRCIRHLAADIDNFLISARPTYASLPSLSA